MPEHDGLSDEHRPTVATTWSLSVKQADRPELEGIARTLLDVASIYPRSSRRPVVEMT
ncbi:hypothetical protein [Amycolatopsis thailandensis]|uniref:hypothetical protein n=1 Tax=Amycolatopsis thailandensis TaxID=589330 RepID=UPI00142D56D2|nr:hypothetical protein [Amycolatopsis thailandensis]